MNRLTRREGAVALRSLAVLSCFLVASSAEPARAQTSVGPRQSSPIALTGNNTKLVNVNPEANSVSVFDVTSEPATKLAEITVGTDPSSVAVHPNGMKAYVSNAFSGSVSDSVVRGR